MIKSNNNIEATQISVPFTKPYAEICVLRTLFISKILLRFSAEIPVSRVLVAIYI